AIGRARAEAQAGEAEVSAAELRVRNQVRGALAAYRDAQAARAAHPGHMLDAESLFQKARRAYHLGEFSLLELLDALEAVWEARSGELELRWAEARATTELLRATAHFGLR